jgi:hypothetical protein
VKVDTTVVFHFQTQNVERDLELGMAPPAYEEPPVYTKTDEPITFAMYLFKFGFCEFFFSVLFSSSHTYLLLYTVFPPFWILGACILLSPLRAPEPSSLESSDAPSAWLPDKTEAERQAIIDHMRKAELKWAWRCLWALLVVVFFGVAAGVTIYAVMRT